MSVRGTANTVQLIEKARDPSVPPHEQHAAFALLVEQSRHLVFGCALASLRDIEEARDVSQDAFTTAWLHLHQLRDAHAFAAWLRRIVATQCHRRLRRRACEPDPAGLESADTEVSFADYRSLVASAIAALPEAERHIIVLFYFLGHTQEEIARILGLKTGTVGKRLYAARLRIRRSLPPAVRREFVRLALSPGFAGKVRLGILDEYVGTYRFERRPDLEVSITREGDHLIGDGGGQRNVLSSLDDDVLLISRYDGEARFRRNRRGRITGFVYYEFGRRLGIARKLAIAE